MEFVGKVNNGGQSVSRAGMSWEISEEGKPAIDMVAAPMCMEACIRHMLREPLKRCVSLGDMRYGYIEIT